MLTQETLKTPRISTYALSREESMHVCLVEGGKTWITPYPRYLADGILTLEPIEARVVKKNLSKYTCTALMVGCDDVASCCSVGVLTRRQVDS